MYLRYDDARILKDGKEHFHIWSECAVEVPIITALLGMPFERYEDIPCPWVHVPVEFESKINKAASYPQLHVGSKNWQRCVSCVRCSLDLHREIMSEPAPDFIDRVIRTCHTSNDRLHCLSLAFGKQLSVSDVLIAMAKLDEKILEYLHSCVDDYYLFLPCKCNGSEFQKAKVRDVFRRSGRDKLMDLELPKLGED